MSKCKHNQQYVLVEDGKAFTAHYRDKNGSIEHDTSFGDYTGAIIFACSICKFKKRFTSKNRPKWLEARLDEVLTKDTTP